MGEESLALFGSSLAVVRPHEGNGAIRHLGDWLSDLGEVGTKFPVLPGHSQEPQQRHPGSWGRVLSNGDDGRLGTDYAPAHLMS